MLEHVRRFLSQYELDRKIEERCKACLEMNMVVWMDALGFLKLLPALEQLIIEQPIPLEM